MPIMFVDYGHFWMFKLEQTKKDSPYAAKLRDLFRSDFERFIVYYYGDIKRDNDEQFNCYHLRTMLRELEETKNDADQKHILHYPELDLDSFKGVGDAHTYMKIMFSEQARRRAKFYLDKVAEFWFFMDGQDDETVLMIINKNCYPRMPELVDQEFMHWFCENIHNIRI